jgi:hypothetical protein
MLDHITRFLLKNEFSVSFELWDFQSPYELNNSIGEKFILFVGSTPYQCRCFRDPKTKWMANAPHSCICFWKDGDIIDGEHFPSLQMLIEGVEP